MSSHGRWYDHDIVIMVMVILKQGIFNAYNAQTKALSYMVSPPVTQSF
jgi:hypothetical protein